jgi:hypothetical protein
MIHALIAEEILAPARLRDLRIVEWIIFAVSLGTLAQRARSGARRAMSSGTPQSPGTDTRLKASNIFSKSDVASRTLKQTE